MPANNLGGKKMNITNKQVSHHQYGVGIVTDQTMTAVTVEFREKYGIKKFMYPSAFESFLELCDPASKKTMDGELLLIREQAEAERKQRDEENKKRFEAEKLVQLEQKRAATKKRSPIKKMPSKLKKRTENPEPAEEDSDE
jgi:hypothetical protein